MRVCEDCGKEKAHGYFVGADAVCRRCRRKDRVAQRRQLRSTPEGISSEIMDKWECFRRQLRPLPSCMLEDLRARGLL